MFIRTTPAASLMCRCNSHTENLTSVFDDPVPAGVESSDLTSVGLLLGQKTLLNEFVAFQSLNRIQAGFDPDFDPLDP